MLINVTITVAAINMLSLLLFHWNLSFHFFLQEALKLAPKGNEQLASRYEVQQEVLVEAKRETASILSKKNHIDVSITTRRCVSCNLLIYLLYVTPSLLFSFMAHRLHAINFACGSLTFRSLQISFLPYLAWAGILKRL